MEFFVDNWLWFLVAAIVILMTLIGYIAEKTDFGRSDIPKKEKIKREKPKKEKVRKEKQPKEETQEIYETEAMPEVQMSLATDSILEEPEENEPVEDLNVPCGDLTFEEPTLNEDSTLGNVEELSDSFADMTFEEPTIEAPENQIGETEILEDLSVPFGDTSFSMPISEVEEVVENEPTEELKLDDINTLNIDLPDLDTIVNEEDDSDDVWKF